MSSGSICIATAWESMWQSLVHRGKGSSAITELPTGRDRRGAVAGDVEDVGDYTELAW